MVRSSGMVLFGCTHTSYKGPEEEDEFHTFCQILRCDMSFGNEPRRSIFMSPSMSRGIGCDRLDAVEVIGSLPAVLCQVRPVDEDDTNVLKPPPGCEGYNDSDNELEAEFWDMTRTSRVPSWVKSPGMTLYIRSECTNDAERR